MTRPELKLKKAETDSAIMGLLQSFEKESGMSVKSLSLGTAPTMLGDSSVVHVQIGLELS